MNPTRLSHGRVVVPAPLREKYGFRDGDEVIWEERDGELLLTTRHAQLRRAQNLIRRAIPADVSLVDELIAERRHEAT